MQLLSNSLKSAGMALFCFMVLGATRVSAIDYYVSTVGDDLNDGLTIATPFATVQNAADQMVAGDYDHRIVDGKGAVTFLVRVKEALEDPRRLLLDL